MKNSWAVPVKEPGGNQPAERKKYIMLQMKKMCKSENTCKNSEINNSKVIGRL